MSHSQQYLKQVAQIAQAIEHETVERIAVGLGQLRDRGGRLFLLGVGGGAANCSHAVNDFRKLTGIEAYSPCDNVAELTARTNDEGWSTVFEAWLRTSKANEKDAVFVFSVGGGDADRDVSVNIVRGLDEAKRRGLTIYGIVGRDGGYTKQVGDEVIVVPMVDSGHVTPHTESFQAVIWHCIVCHPSLMIQEGKWESLATTKVSAPLSRAVFLDRDGVINLAVLHNGRPYPPSSVDELEFLPGVSEAINALHQAGFRIIVATNQPDVATGVQRREVVEAIHERIRRAFPIDDIKVCYHVDQDGCTCRKPKPGMLLEAAEEWSLNLEQSFMVGDRWRDIEAGRAAGCRTILVKSNYAEQQAGKPDAIVSSLLEASAFILTNSVQDTPAGGKLCQISEM